MSDTVLSPVHLHTTHGDAFSVPFHINTNAANVFMGVGINANNIAKKVFIYRACCTMYQSGTSDVVITYTTGTDSNFTSALTPVNHARAGGSTSLTTVFGSPAGATAPTATSGTVRSFFSLMSDAVVLELFQNGSGVYIPANTVNLGVNFYMKLPVGGFGNILIEYIEY